MRIMPTGFSKHTVSELRMTPEDMAAADAWIDAIPDNVYDPCPCGCGKKFRFAVKEGIGPHEDRFRENFIANIAK